MQSPKKSSPYSIKPPAHLTEAEMEAHPSWRRFTRKYRRKKNIVRNIWLASGLITIALPLNWQILMILATTFLSFCVLDETA